MNKDGNPATLVAAHPGNLNAAKHGVYSERMIQPRAAEIFAELTDSFQFSPTERLAVREVAYSTAVLEAIDRDLDERGVVDRRGEPRALLSYRSRVSRQLQRWMADIAPTIERQSEGGRVDLGRDDYIRELKRIAVGRDKTASAHDRVAAMKELLKLDAPSNREPAVSIIRIIREDDGTKQIVDASDVLSDEASDAASHGRSSLAGRDARDGE